MVEELKEIDTSAIKKLAKIKKEQDRLKHFRHKAEEMKGNVDPVVYDRVAADYEGRLRALEEEAVPLKVEVRREYAKLKAVYGEINDALDEAQKEKQELEFRHAVGELSKEQLTRRLQEPEKTLQQCKAHLSEADKLKARFLEAVESEEELEARPEEVTVFDTAPAGGPAADGEPGAEEAVAPPAETVVAPSAPVPAAEADAAERTFVVPRAKLVAVNEDGEEQPQEHHLGALNYVGRAPDNHIRIQSPAVSRKHAVLEAGVDGFAVKDLDSENGTYVNKERVSECTLSDGDRIRFGDVEFVFRCG